MMTQPDPSNYSRKRWLFLLLLVLISIQNRTWAQDSTLHIKNGVSMQPRPLKKTTALEPGISAGDKIVHIDTGTHLFAITDAQNHIVGYLDDKGNITLTGGYEPGFWGNCKSYLPAVLIFLAFLTAFFVLRPLIQKSAKTDNGNTGPVLWKNYVSKTISIVLLISFVSALGLLFLINSNMSGDNSLNEKWFEVLKNYLLLLGTSFTTIMGYFFGQSQAEKLEKNNQQLEEKLKSQGSTADEQVASLLKQRDVLLKKLERRLKDDSPTQL